MRTRLFSGRPNEQISHGIRFVNLSLEKAITKILTNINHVVIFEQDIIQVKIYGAVRSDISTNRSPLVQQSNGTPPDRKIRPSVTPYLKKPRQNIDTAESALDSIAKSDIAETEDTENTDEEAREPESSEAEDTQYTDEETREPEPSEAEDTESTDERILPGEESAVDETEAILPDKNNEDETSDENESENTDL